MAAKVNTRFVLGLVLALGAALALLGGVYVLKLKGDATRSQRKGADAMAKGDYKAAYDQFGRALNKDPGNFEYLQNVIDALTKIVPQTAGEAGEYYSRYVSTFGHAAVHNPKDVDSHMRLLTELHGSARRTNDSTSWESLLAAADSMQQQIADGDPAKPLARVYRAIAIARLSASKSDEELQESISELDQAASSLATSDLAWAAEINCRLSWVQKMESSGRSRTSLEAEREELGRMAKQAIERSTDGPETALAYLLFVVYQQITSPQAASNEEIRAAAEHLAAVVKPQDSPGLVNNAAAALVIVPEIGRARALALLQRAADANPTGYDYRLNVARLQYEQGDLDQAEAAARIVLAAEKLPVSLMARLLFDLRPQAAALIGDVEAGRLDRVDASEREAQIAKMVAARDVLAAMSIDEANDPFVTRADAKIAFARNQFMEAAQKFEQLVRVTDSRDPEMLVFASASLQRINQLGLARERITRAVALNPGVPQWLISKAELEFRTGQIDQAESTIKDIPDSFLSDPRAQQVINAVRMASAGGTAAATDDPIKAAINSAQDSLRRNEVDNARATLLSALQSNPDSLSLLQALAQVEISGGNREAAQQYVDRGLKINSSDAILNQIASGLRYDDRVLATVEYLKNTITDEKALQPALLVSMVSLASNHRVAAEDLRKQGKEQDAEKFRQIAERADAEAAKVAAAMQTSDPENPQLLEYQFITALKARDWTKAEELLATARRLNLDSAGGALFEGRLELARENTRQAISALETATDRLSFSSFAWRTLAFAYQAAGNFVQAERSFEQAYRCNPNDIAGTRVYLALLQRRGDKTRALQILRSIHRLAPQDVELRESWLTLESEVGDKALALRERMLQYLANKQDRANAASLALLLGTLDPTPETMLGDDGQPLYSPQRWAAMSAGDQDQVRQTTRQDWATRADEIINGLSSSGSDDLRIAVLRATIQRERGDVMGGEATLRDFINKHEKAQQTEEMFVELGRYQAAAEHYSDAVASLRQAVALTGPQQREAETQLGILLMQLQQYKDALEVLKSAQAKQDDQSTRLQIIECMINLGQFDDAEKMLADASTGKSGSVITLLSASIARGRGMALVARGDVPGAERIFGQQRDLLARAEQQDPTNPLPRILLAQSLIDEYNRTKRMSLLDDAMVALDRADRIRAGVPQVNAMRVAIQKERGDVAGAIGDARRLVEADPGNHAARRELIQLLIDSGNRDAATQAIDTAIQLYPTVAGWHELRGDVIRQRQGTVAQVIDEYALAYKNAPAIGMLLKLCGAMLDMNPPDCRGVVSRIEARKDDLANEPVVREAYAVALSCLGQRDQAIEQLRLAYATHKERAQKDPNAGPEVLDWYLALSKVFPGEQARDGERLQEELSGGNSSLDDLIGLSRFWARSGQAGLSRGIELARLGLSKCTPDDDRHRATANEDLGGMLVMTGDMGGAAEAFTKVVELQPSNWSAMNNLAYILSTELNEASKAVPLAESLLKLAPGRPDILDTVGWVFYKNNDLARAKQHLSDSLTILPTVDAYLHLAEVLARSKDPAGAEKQLQAAEKLNPSPDQQQKIKSLRDDIAKGGSGPGGPAAGG